MCVSQPARSPNLPRVASRLRPRAGVDASSSVPPALILGHRSPGSVAATSTRSIAAADAMPPTTPRSEGHPPARPPSRASNPDPTPTPRVPRRPPRAKYLPSARASVTDPSPAASFVPLTLPSPFLPKVRRRRSGRSQARPRRGVQAQVREIHRRVRRVRRPRGEGHHRRGALHGAVLRHVGVRRQVRGAQPLQEHQVSRRNQRM